MDKETSAYIRESWYPASWAHMLDRAPIKRKFLGEDVVLYRTEEGVPVALGNACPHRFAPLHKGRLHGDSIACPYHGLRFSPDGQCSHNPHGPAPKSVRLRAYPLHERYGMIWIWMGEAANADPSLLPPMPDSEDDRFDWVTGYLHVQGHYQLVIDNLLDLTHVEFMHPFLAGDDRNGEGSLLNKTQVRCFEDGDCVVSEYYQNDMPLTPLVAALWDDAPSRISMVATMRWYAPANLVQENRFDAAEETRQCEGTALIPFCHLLTPETASTTHYFWGTGRNLKRGDAEVSRGLEMGVGATFSNEDEPMIADIQGHIGERELMDMKPLLLPIDKSAVLARRSVSQRIAREAIATADAGSVPA